MSYIFRIVFLLAVLIPVSSCGVKGKLKSPAQIERIEAKKAAEAEKKAKEEGDKNLNDNAAPAENN